MKKTVFSALLALCLILALLPFGALADAWQLRWDLSTRGVLTLTGSGAVPDGWVQSDSASWASRRNHIKSVTVSPGFTALGAGLFADCPNLESIEIPATVTRLGAGLFRGSTKLRSVVYGGTEAAWNRTGWEQSDLPPSVQITFRGEPAPTPTPEPTASPAPTVQPTASPAPAGTFQWEMTANGDLTVTGNGPIPDHWVETSAHSWRGDRGRIRSAVIADGITSLGAGTLSAMPKLAAVTISSTVTVLAADTFSGSRAIRDVYYGGTEAAWKAAGGENAGLPSGAAVHFAGAPAPASPFVDVVPGSYCAKAVDWALAKGVTTGTDASHFSPDETCSRAEVVTFLWRASGSPSPSGSGNPFVDVRPERFYYRAVLWAVEQNITTGTDASHFSPDETCSRAEVVTFLWRAGGGTPVRADNPFADVVPGTYYFSAVLWALSRGITTGTDAAHFSPQENCTRGQVVTFLWRDLA